MKVKSWKQIVVLQLVILIYTLSTVAAKFASRYPMFSLGFLISTGIEIFILGVYAILWQQIVKRFDLSIAYANKGFSIFWSLIWATVFFGEQITLKNVLGVIIVFLGIMVVNSDGNK